jgi:hypothetical protein
MKRSDVQRGIEPVYQSPVDTPQRLPRKVLELLGAAGGPLGLCRFFLAAAGRAQEKKLERARFTFSQIIIDYEEPGSAPSRRNLACE